MDERIARLATPEGCERFVKNAVRLNRLDLALKARIRAVELRAEAYGSTSQAEKECIQAVFAQEEVLTINNRLKRKRSRSWQAIRRLGIVPAAERAMNGTTEVEYPALLAIGLQEFALEAVILRHPDVFSVEAVQQSQTRMTEWAALVV